jgi:hypothetical protein
MGLKMGTGAMARTIGTTSRTTTRTRRTTTTGRETRKTAVMTFYELNYYHDY